MRNRTMADAVDLVRAYLNVNGYFTVTEYPLLEPLRRGSHRMVTDLDILAFRFAGAGPGPHGGASPTLASSLREPDPVLARSRDESDMIVGEVKEGRAKLNRAGRDPRVLAAALVRFGCCDATESRHAVGELLRTGDFVTNHGHRIRLVVFGARVSEESSTPYTAISLGHVLTFLRDHLRENWDVFRHAQLTDPALGFLGLLEKLGPER